jgi:hypothetical protein
MSDEGRSTGERANSADWTAGAKAAEYIVTTQANEGRTADAIEQQQAEVAAQLVGISSQTEAEREWLAGYSETVAACVGDLRELDYEAGL